MKNNKTAERGVELALYESEFRDFNNGMDEIESCDETWNLEKDCGIWFKTDRNDKRALIELV